MSGRKRKDPAPDALVALSVPLFRRDLEEFREYCAAIDADPRTVVYSFIKAVNEGHINVTPASGAPFTQ